jgi:hypothetical protein
MGFGIDTSGNISRNTSYSVNAAEKISEVGNIDEMTAYGGTEETTLESYVDAASFANEATNQQAAGDTIVTAHSLIESNTEYARQSKTTRTSLPSTTTT